MEDKTTNVYPRKRIRKGTYHPTIDVLTEHLILFREVGKIPNVFGQKKASYQAVYSYAHKGRKNYSGVTVYLEHCKTPTGGATSLEAIRRFMVNLNS